MSESQVTSPSGLSLLSDHRSTRSCCVDAAASACEVLLALPFVASAAVLLAADGGIEVLYTKARIDSDKVRAACVGFITKIRNKRFRTLTLQPSSPLSPLPPTVLPLDCMPECIKSCVTVPNTQTVPSEDADALAVLGILPSPATGITALCSPVVSGAVVLGIIVVSASTSAGGIEVVSAPVAAAAQLLKYALLSPQPALTPTPASLVSGAMDVCQAVQQAQTVVGVLSSSLTGLHSLLSASLVELYLLDTNRLARIYSTDQMTLASPYQDQHVSFVPLTAPGDANVPHSVVASIAGSGQTLTLSDVSTHPSYRASVDGPAQSSGLFVPLLSAIGTVIGVVKVLRLWPFVADDIHITGFITDAVGGALRALVLRSELQSARHCADSILSCLAVRTPVVVSSYHPFVDVLPSQEATTVVYNDVIEFSNHMLDLARPCLQAQMVSMFLVDRTRQQLWCAAAATEGSHTTRPSSDGTVFGTGTRVSMFKGVLGNVVSTGNPVRLSSLSGDILTDVLLEDKLGYACCHCCAVNTFRY
jgi:putative methionine-R-sulfoxide reductase with GAF domain